MKLIRITKLLIVGMIQPPKKKRIFTNSIEIIYLKLNFKISVRKKCKAKRISYLNLENSTSLYSEIKTLSVIRDATSAQ